MSSVRWSRRDTPYLPFSLGRQLMLTRMGCRRICFALLLVVAFTYRFGKCRYWCFHFVRLLFIQQPGNTHGIYHPSCFITSNVLSAERLIPGGSYKTSVANVVDRCWPGTKQVRMKPNAAKHQFQVVRLLFGDIARCCHYRLTKRY